MKSIFLLIPERQICWFPFLLMGWRYILQNLHIFSLGSVYDLLDWMFDDDCGCYQGRA